MLNKFVKYCSFVPYFYSFPQLWFTQSRVYCTSITLIGTFVSIRITKLLLGCVLLNNKYFFIGRYLKSCLIINLYICQNIKNIQPYLHFRYIYELLPNRQLYYSYLIQEVLHCYVQSNLEHHTMICVYKLYIGPTHETTFYPIDQSYLTPHNYLVCRCSDLFEGLQIISVGIIVNNIFACAFMQHNCSTLSLIINITVLMRYRIYNPNIYFLINSQSISSPYCNFVYVTNIVIALWTIRVSTHSVKVLR